MIKPFWIKRCFDIVLSMIGIVLFAPVMVVVAVLITLTSPGPVFYCQQRIGRFGLPFTIVKFRTMFAASASLNTITVTNDPRITPIGRILRRYKLDELPQLWNVLCGNMSFVGPRPDVSGYADVLKETDKRILLVRPGITGPASIYFKDEEKLLLNAANAHDYNDTVIWPIKILINKYYADHWSFWKDLGFIFITIIPCTDRVFGLMKPISDLVYEHNKGA